jgi:hypothetical protein
MAATYTHLIRRLLTVRYSPHHHRDSPTGVLHAVAALPAEPREGMRVVTVCGQTERVEADERIYGDPLNCYAAETCTVKEPTCRDCRKALGMTVPTTKRTRGRSINTGRKLIG